MFFSSARGQFEEMCGDILARVEPPLQSLLENTSQYYFALLYSGFSKSIFRRCVL